MEPISRVSRIQAKIVQFVRPILAVRVVRVHPFGYIRSVVRLVYSRSDVVVRPVVVEVVQAVNQSPRPGLYPETTGRKQQAGHSYTRSQEKPNSKPGKNYK